MTNKTSIALLASLLGFAGAVLSVEGSEPAALQHQKDVFGPRLAGLASGGIDPNMLEPCINGQVSHSGLFPTQAQEVAAHSDASGTVEGMSGPMAASSR